jgi:PAS domain S-box-containing protein
MENPAGDHAKRFAASLTEDGRYRLLIEAVTDYAIYMLDIDGIVISWNPGAQRFKGYQEAEILGEHFSKFYTEEDRQTGLPARALATAAAEGKFEGEGWRVRKDGGRFWASVVIDALYDDQGQHVGFAKITRDITERREAQIALEKTREALFRSQKLEAIGQLTGGIAHDFNNLLAAILGSLELTRKLVDQNGRAAHLIDNALRAARRGASLTKHMLAFARRQELNLESIDLPGLMRDMTDLLERSLGPTIVIEMRFPAGLASVSSDPAQLEMAVLNLAVNGRDAMPEGGALVLEARPETISPGHTKLKPGSYVCLAVTDTGSGMDEETLARATDPFFTTKELGKGTGLGLSMVHGLAEQSGGQLLMKSKQGVGTTAELWLPVAQKVSTAGVLAEAIAASNRPLTILAVDDDSLVLTNIIAMLEDLGHTAFEASSGEQALEVLRRRPSIELVITDHAMPPMTGLQLIAKIKAEWPDLPIVLATGYAELPPGADAIPRLAKPFLQYDLAQAVANATTSKPGGQVVRLRAR